MRILACGVIAAAALSCASVPSLAAPPPKNPSNSQINAAQAAKDSAAATVGHLSALITQGQQELQRLNAQAQLAEQKYALAMQKLSDAKLAAEQARQASDAAQKQLDAARTNLQQFIRNSYLSPTVSSGPGGLLTASDPNALLQRGDYLRYVSDHHLDVMGAMDRATVAKSNADAKARQLVQLQTTLTQQAQSAFQVAKAAREQQQSRQVQLQAEQASYQKQLSAAQSHLADLNGQRAKYNSWVAEQRRIAAARAAAAAAARARAEAAARAAQAAAAAAANNGGGGGGGGAPQGGGTVYNPPSSNGGWTAAKGQAAVNRAMTALGMPYAWAGGNANGPTYGVNSPGTDGWNDSQVYGYDCSGLVMYAWASQGLYLAHYAATQFSQAGSYHPSPGNFMPGDLLFWGLPGQADIHHVAIYIGGGNVIQAPYSGTVVQITPWTQVSGDYFGATRPLT